MKNKVQEPKKTNLFRRSTWGANAVFLLLLAALTLAVYGRYLFGAYYFISHHGDSVYHAVPMLLDRARNLWQAGIGAQYNLLVGFGNAQDALDPMNALMLLFGEGAIPYMMGVFQAAKVFLAGIFFYAYARKMAFHENACIFIGLGYAFCGPMLSRSGFISYPNEYLFAAVCLYAAELLLQEKAGWKRMCFPLAFALLLWSVDAVRIVVYILLFSVYAGFRAYTGAPQTAKRGILRAAGGMFTLCLLGFGLVAVFQLPDYLAWVGSSRLAARTGQGLRGYGLVNLRTVFNFVLSALTNSQDVLLSGPYTSYLGGPSLFVGLANLLMIPQAFAGSPRKTCVGYALCAVAIAAYAVFTPLRVISHGLAYDSFKLSSFWIVILCLYMAGGGWTRLFREGGLCVWLLLACGAACAAAVWTLPALGALRLPRKQAVVITLLICASVFAILCYKRYAGGKPLYARLCAVMLLGILCVDIFFNAAISQSRYVNMTRADYELSANRSGLRELARAFKREENDAFRISNYMTSASGPFCDSLANDYLSTASYIGATGGNSAYDALCDFLSGDRYVPAWGYRPYCNSNFSSMLSVNTLLGVRYMTFEKVIMPDPPYCPYGYTLSGKGDWWILENQNAVPLALLYDSVVSEVDARVLEKAQRRELLLQSALVEADSPLLQGALRVENSLAWDMLGQLEQNALPAREEAFEEVGEVLRVKLDAPADEAERLILFADITDDPNEVGARFDAKLLYVQWAGEDGMFSDANSRRFEMTLGDDQLLTDIPAAGVRYIRICNESNCDTVRLRCVSAAGDDYFAHYQRAASRLRACDFVFTRLENDHIEGRVTLEADRLLCLPFARDAGWEAWVNGERVRIHTVNKAFMGVLLHAGENEVRFRYTAPGRTAGVSVSVISAALYAAWVIYSLRRDGKRETLCKNAALASRGLRQFEKEEERQP